MGGSTVCVYNKHCSCACRLLVAGKDLATRVGAVSF